MVDKAELKYIAYCAIFAVVYFFFALPWLIKSVGDNIILKFAVFTIGILIILNIYFKSRSGGGKIDFVKSLEYMLVVLALSIYIPPYSVVPWTGEIQNGALLSSAAVDYFFATMGHQYLNLSGMLITIWTYIIIPILLLFIASRISKSSFVKSI